MSVDEWAKENGWGTATVDSGGTGVDRPRFDWMGADRDKHERGQQDSDSVRPSPTPLVPDYGITTEELAQHVEYLNMRAKLRVYGPGHEQYSLSSHQKFEDYTPAELFKEIRDELLDVINYVAMLDILIGRTLGKATQ